MMMSSYYSKLCIVLLTQAASLRLRPAAEMAAYYSVGVSGCKLAKTCADLSNACNGDDTFVSRKRELVHRLCRAEHKAQEMERRLRGQTDPDMMHKLRRLLAFFDDFAPDHALVSPFTDSRCTDGPKANSEIRGLMQFIHKVTTDSMVKLDVPVKQDGGCFCLANAAAVVKEAKSVKNGAKDFYEKCKDLEDDNSIIPTDLY